MNQKIKNKINGMLLMNVLLLGYILISMRTMMKSIQASLWKPVGGTPSVITAITYSWTKLTLVVSETAKYHHTVIVDNPILMDVGIVVLYNVYSIIRVNRMKNTEEFSENKPMSKKS
ncbi:hypothetical protein [Clostridium psychrophilum]|uniref:hypothetical protein n=1 Tax=Clostridium psychrophilum TaxID=132926 RepID=UPI001C0AED1F|nr:hypothetical protein [Clostridium psychrophilum]MBU3182526.1 hypothetical protein [Clostridium psychrophilum]